MIGSGIAGMISTILGVRALSIGVGGLPGILAIRPQNYLGFIISVVVAIIVPFLLTLFMAKRGIMAREGAQVADIETAGNNTTESTSIAAAVPDDDFVEEIIFSPVDGQLTRMEDIDDPVFSQKLMGDGFAVKPTSNKVYSPIFGKVTNIFDSKHAIGLETEGGVEVLVHMGLETVELKGRPFDIKVSEREEITPDTLLAEVNLDMIKEDNKATDIIIVFTNMKDNTEWKITADGMIKTKDTIGDLKL